MYLLKVRAGRTWICRWRLRLSHRQPTYASFAERVFFILGEGNSDPISQPRRLFLLVLKSNYKRKPQPNPQNSPGFVLQLDETTTQLYVVSTQKDKLYSDLAIRRRTYPPFRVKSE